MQRFESKLLMTYPLTSKWLLSLFKKEEMNDGKLGSVALWAGTDLGKLHLAVMVFLKHILFLQS